jgi:hypothetical protein
MQFELADLLCYDFGQALALLHPKQNHCFWQGVFFSVGNIDIEITQLAKLLV